jgi:hypothetical protein
MPEYRYELPIADENALRLFLARAFGFEVPDQAVCPGHCAPWQAFCDAYFARSRVAIWKASRGLGGKSLLLAMLGLTEALTLKVDVNLLGGSGEQSKRIHEYMRKAWDYADSPRQLLASDPYLASTTLTWGNTIRALLASMTSVRGPHPVRLRLDEVDETDLAIVNAALGQPMSKAGVSAQTVLSSTHHNPQGTMTAVLQMAAEKSWPVYEWCYHETMYAHGWLDPAEVEAKRTDVTAQAWNIEYDLQQPSAEDRAIIPAAVGAMFQRSRGEFAGDNSEYCEVEPPMAGATYQHGADWAKSNDWTVICTVRIDCTPARLVAFERTGRRPWPSMVARFEDRIQRYGGEAAHDGTGLGDVVDGYLTTPAEKVVLAGRSRSDLLSNYVNLCEKGGIVAPMITYAYREHLYASLADLYGSAGHLPDSICAMALATKGVGVPVVQAVDVSPAEMEAIWAQAEQEQADAGMLAPSSRGDVRAWQPYWSRRRRYW